MGFDVTAAYAIFFVAVLAGGSAALGAYWGSADHVEESRRTQEDRAQERAHTNLTVLSASYDGGASRFTATIKNYGGTVVDISELVYLVDGQIVASTSVESASIGAAPATDIWQPTETLTLQLSPVSPSPTHFKLVAANGAMAYWGS